MNRPLLPLISIGMPAYNSERTVGDAIDCLLAQDFEDFELIISDNASSDGTWDLVQEYARRDDRVVCIRQPRNIGANGNYTAVAQAARGKYFKWASSNDWCAPSFLSRCVGYLEANPDTVMVAPRTKLFEDAIDRGIDYKEDVEFRQSDPVQRFVRVTGELQLNNVLNGLIRAEDLRHTRYIEHYPGADIVLVGHLALLGKIALLDEYLFGRRMDRETATRMMSADAVRRHHYPDKTWRSLFPTWRFMRGWATAVLSTRLSASEKVRAMRWVGQMAYWNGSGILRDLRDALRHPIRG